jgi:hypothetical protein
MGSIILFIFLYAYRPTLKVSIVCNVLCSLLKGERAMRMFVYCSVDLRLVMNVKEQLKKIITCGERLLLHGRVDVHYRIGSRGGRMLFSGRGVRMVVDRKHL